MSSPSKSNTRGPNGERVISVNSLGLNRGGGQSDKELNAMLEEPKKKKSSSVAADIRHKRAELKKKREAERIRSQEAKLKTEAKIVGQLQTLVKGESSKPVQSLKDGASKLIRINRKKKEEEKKEEQDNNISILDLDSERNSLSSMHLVFNKKEESPKPALSSSTPSKKRILKKNATHTATLSSSLDIKESKQRLQVNDSSSLKKKKPSRSDLFKMKLDSAPDAKKKATGAMSLWMKQTDDDETSIGLSERERILAIQKTRKAIPMKKRHTVMEKQHPQILKDLHKQVLEEKKVRPRRWSVASVTETILQQYQSELSSDNKDNNNIDNDDNNNIKYEGMTSSDDFKRRSVLHASQTHDENEEKLQRFRKATARRGSMPGLFSEHIEVDALNDDNRYNDMLDTLRERLRYQNRPEEKLNNNNNNENDGEELPMQLFDSLFGPSTIEEEEDDEAYVQQQNLHMQHLTFLGWYLWAQKQMANRRYAAKIRLYGGTKIHKRLNAWHIKACFQRFERAPGLSLSANEILILKRQWERSCVELPRVAQIETWKTAYPIILTTLRLYKKELGSSSEQYIEASNHRELVANQLRAAGQGLYVDKCNRGEHRHRRKHTTANNAADDDTKDQMSKSSFDNTRIQSSFSTNVG